jgi:hypothetical protein
MRENIYQLKSVKVQAEVAPGLEAYSGAIWMLRDIALYMRSTELSASRIVNQPGFPRPLGNQHRNRRWLSQDVKAFFENLSKTPYSTRPALQVETNYEPSTITFRE